MLVLEKIKVSFGEFSLLKDNVICLDYTSDEPLNVEKSIVIVETIKKLAGGQPCVVIHNVGDRYIFTTDAARFLGSQLNTDEHMYLARAIVTTNSAARLATTNFISLYKPLIPSRLFAELNEALTWAEEIIATRKAS